MTGVEAASLLVMPPVLAGIAAVGAVLFIKTRRRVQGTLDARHTDTVPVNPLSIEDAQAIWRRYLVGVGLLVGSLFLVLIRTH